MPRLRAWLDPIPKRQLSPTLRPNPLARLCLPTGMTSKSAIAFSPKTATQKMDGGRQPLSTGVARFSSCGGQAVRRGRPIQKHRLTLALICPNDGVENGGIDSNKSPDEPRPRFPHDWAAIKVDQIVLAKEDGPCEQWWEAKTIKLDKDLFTLQWRDRPDLPSIERPRSSLGLMHPAPKVR